MKERETGQDSPNQEPIIEATSGLGKREQEAWQKVLGTPIEVKPLPESITPDVERNLEKMGMGLRYIPALDIGNLDYLRERGVDGYLAELQQRYPRWKPFESLSDRELADHTAPRNLEKWYWERVNDGNVAFPVLPGQWMAVEIVDKPIRGEKYTRTPFAERIGFPDDRFSVSWNDARDAIERKKPRILSEIVLPAGADLRLLEALEWNLLGNREGWGKTDTYEWTNTEYHEPGRSRRLVVGSSDHGGPAEVDWDLPVNSSVGVGFRAAVVFGA